MLFSCYSRSFSFLKNLSTLASIFRQYNFRGVVDEVVRFGNNEFVHVYSSSIVLSTRAMGLTGLYAIRVAQTILIRSLHLIRRRR